MNIPVSDDCLKTYNKLKFREQDLRYIVYKFEKELIVSVWLAQVIERVGKKDETWDEFVNSLPNDEYRYCVFDFEFTNADHMKISKLIFINWNAADTPLKGRFKYATGKQNFKGYLNLNTKDFTLESKNDVLLFLTLVKFRRHG